MSRDVSVSTMHGGTVLAHTNKTLQGPKLTIGKTLKLDCMCIYVVGSS